MSALENYRDDKEVTLANIGAIESELNEDFNQSLTQQAWADKLIRTIQPRYAAVIMSYLKHSPEVYYFAVDEEHAGGLFTIDEDRNPCAVSNKPAKVIAIKCYTPGQDGELKPIKIEFIIMELEEIIARENKDGELY